MFVLRRSTQISSADTHRSETGDKPFKMYCNFVPFYFKVCALSEEEILSSVCHSSCLTESANCFAVVAVCSDMDTAPENLIAFRRLQTASGKQPTLRLGAIGWPCISSNSSQSSSSSPDCTTRRASINPQEQHTQRGETTDAG